jgi:serine/arginine repetitive matrix protein 1
MFPNSLDFAAAHRSQPNIKHLQIQLTGFLEKEAAPFCQELWKLCLSAQASNLGVPKELLEAKKLEIRKGQVSSA